MCDQGSNRSVNVGEDEIVCIHTISSSPSVHGSPTHGDSQPFAHFAQLPAEARISQSLDHMLGAFLPTA